MISFERSNMLCRIVPPLPHGLLRSFFFGAPPLHPGELVTIDASGNFSTWKGGFGVVVSVFEATAIVLWTTEPTKKPFDPLGWDEEVWVPIQGPNDPRRSV